MQRACRHHPAEHCILFVSSDRTRTGVPQPPLQAPSPRRGPREHRRRVAQYRAYSLRMFTGLPFGSTFLSVIWIPFLAVLASAAVIGVSHRHGSDRDSVRDRLVLVWFVTAVGTVLLLTLQPGPEGFGRARPSILNPVSPFAGKDALANVVLFLPVGFFAGLCWRAKSHSVAWVTGFVFVLSLSVEFAQKVLPIDRAASTPDVLYNVLGGFAGAVAAALITRRVRAAKDSQHVAAR